MAKIPNVPVKFNRTISDPNLGAAAAQTPAPRFTDPGPSPKAALIKQIGETLLEANVGFNQADLGAQQEEAIQDYLDRRPQGQADLAIEAAGLKTTADRLREAGEDELQIDPILKQFQDRTNRLKKAREQGVMSPEELSTRILSNTREAVNRWPGLYKELLSHSEKVLELSGIKNIVKLDQERAKAAADDQANRLKEMRKSADTLHISYDHFTPDYRKMSEDIQLRQDAIAASQQVDRAAKGEQIVTQQAAKTFLQGYGNRVIIGDSQRLTNQFVAMFQNAQPKDYPALIYQVRAQAEDAKSRLYAAVAGYGINNDPRIADLVTKHTQQMDSLVTRLEKLQSGEDAATVMKNHHQRLVDGQRYEFAQKYNIASLEAMKYIPDAIYQRWTVRKNADLLMSLADSLIMNMVGPALGTSYIESNLKEGVPDGVSLPFAFLDAGGVPQFENAVQTLADTLATNPILDRESDQAKALNAFVNEMRLPQRKGALNNMTTATIENVSKLIDEHLDKALRFRDKEIERLKGNGITVRPELSPDGRLVYTSSDPRVAADLNRKYANPINNGIAALANGLDISIEEARNIAEQRYNGRTLGRTPQDTGAKPLPITQARRSTTAAPFVVRTPEDVKAAVARGAMDQEEADAILLDMEKDSALARLPESTNG